MNAKKTLVFPLIVIGILFGVFGLLTWVNGILIPYFKIGLELTNLEAFLVTFSSYSAYFLMAIPSAFVLARTGYKKGLSLGLVIMAIGYGSYPTDYYNLKMSKLKELQLRLRYSYTNNNAYRIDPAIHHYFQMTAGKQYDDSPDAWCALREAEDVYQSWTFYPDRSKFYFSNWERWLYQREVETDGKTERVYYIDNTQTWAVNGQSYEAKSTIRSEGQDYIYFNVDDKFMYGGPSYKIQIKVTYFDNFDGEWELQYQGEEDDYTPLSVVNERDGKWKTVTFDIDDDHFANGQTGDNDFRLYNGGKHDLVVRFVRVVKTIDPGAR